MDNLLVRSQNKLLLRYGVYTPILGVTLMALDERYPTGHGSLGTLRPATLLRLAPAAAGTRIVPSDAPPANQQLGT